MKRVELVMPFCAIISRHPAAREWGRRAIEQMWGELEVDEVVVPFEAEAYYREEMGEGVGKVMVAALRPRDPVELAEWKLSTNALERRCAAELGLEEPRPLNLDPGYVTQGKLVLATVKDRDHRIYLRDGIFAEVTLRRLRGGWVDNRWTYRDYRGEEVKRFAESCRRRLRAYLIEMDGFRR